MWYEGSISRSDFHGQNGIFVFQTTCMSDYESSEGLQYICFCDDPRTDVSRHAKDIYKDKGKILQFLDNYFF